MGLLINGLWDNNATPDVVTISKNINDSFNSFITADGSSGFKAEVNRYHLYVSVTCPFAARTLIVRKLKKLEEIISISVLEPIIRHEGWEFSDRDGYTLDHINNYKFLHQVYTHAKSDYTGRVSVPVLWDKTTQTIVNVESAQIMRMLNSEFNAFTNVQLDLYPEPLRHEIDIMQKEIHHKVNLGVYYLGFAKTQEMYNKAFDSLFLELDRLEHLLSTQRYLIGDVITEVDWQFFATLIRFDSVYHGLFKCNLRRIIDYPNLSNYMYELYQYPGISELINFEHIKLHYYKSEAGYNPSGNNGIVPKGPYMNLMMPHDRARFSN